MRRGDDASRGLTILDVPFQRLGLSSLQVCLMAYYDLLPCEAASVQVETEAKHE